MLTSRFGSVVGLICCCVPRASAASGDIVQLGTLPNESSSIGVALNSAANVVGYSGTLRPFLWSREQGIQDLTSVFKSVLDVSDVSDTGHIVGRAPWPGNNWQATVWSPMGGQVDLGALGGNTSEARAVNSACVVVGQSDSPVGKRAFRWTAAGGMESLGAFGGPFFDSNAADVSESGVIAGTSQGAGNGTHAFRWTDADGMVDLGTLGGDNSISYGISSGGDHIVGWSHDAMGRQLPFRWTASEGLQALPTLGGFFGLAEAVNDAGAAVGAATDGPGFHHNVLWTDSLPAPIDLNEWLADVNPAAAADWYLVALLDINNVGQITGFGSYRPGGPPGLAPLRAFVLDVSGIPGAAVPEPAGPLVGSLTVAAACAARRRRHP